MPIAMRRQRGAVLIVALVLLLVLTILGTAGIQDTVITERMAGNHRDVALAFESAEMELRRLERSIAKTEPDFTGPMHGYEVPDTTQGVSPFEDSMYADSNVPMSSLSAHVDTLPEYYVERLPLVEGPRDSIVLDGPARTFQYYRITAKGHGASPQTEVILQSTYLPPY